MRKGRFRCRADATPIATVLVLIAAFSPLHAQDSLKRLEALGPINAFAENQCGRVFEGGSQSEISVEGGLNVGLDSLFAKLADLGIDANGIYSKEEYVGVVRDELRVDRSDTRGCRERLSDKLIDIIFAEKRVFKEAPVSEQPFGAASRCRGDWIYASHNTCLDPTKPIHPIVTDGQKCGWTEKTVMVQEEEYSLCPDISHGIESYTQEQIFEEWSGWKRGGYNQDAWCGDVQKKFSSQVGEAVKWTVLYKDEGKKEEFYRKFYYKYFCRVKAEWGAVYRQKRTSACPPAQPVPRVTRVARTCADKSLIVGYEDTTRPACGTQARLELVPGTRPTDILDRYLKQEISEPLCSTCDDLSRNGNAYVECLIERSELLLDGNLLQPLGEVQRSMIELSRQTDRLNEANELILRGQIKRIEMRI